MNKTNKSENNDHTPEQDRILFAETIIGTANIPYSVVIALPEIMPDEWRIWKAGRASVRAVISTKTN